MSPHALRDIQLRDPFLLVEEGTYYLYGSTDPDIWRAPGVGFDVYRGVEPGGFTQFDGPFPAFRPPAGFWARVNFWAPEVYAAGGAHVMLATFLPVDGHRGTAVLRSTSGPLGPFEPWSDGPVTPPGWDCLDGTLFVDDEAAPWLVFCHEWVQVGDGEVVAMRLAPDLRSAAGEPHVLFTATSAPWVAPLAGEAPGSYVTDGPFLHRYADGRLSMLWSSYGPTGNYCIGEAWSSGGGVLGPWRQSQRPLYEADGGHGMLFRALSDELYLAIHTPNVSPAERPIFVAVAETPTGLAATGEVIS